MENSNQTDVIKNNDLSLRVLQALGKMYTAGYSKRGANGAIKAEIERTHLEYKEGEKRKELEYVLYNRIVSDSITVHIEQAVESILN